MRKIREVLRLKYDQACTIREIATSCQVSVGTVSDYLRRARHAGLPWPLPPEADDMWLEQQLFPSAPPTAGPSRPQPAWAVLHQELQKKGVTLQLLWYEYKQAHPDGYQYSQFCERYRRWAGTLDRCLRQAHRAGHKLFVDYAGDTLPFVDAQTGEVHHAQLFVAVLGASNYTFAEATAAQDLPSWITAHIHAFECFGGVPEIVVPDNVKCAVTHPCRYEPDLNPTYLDMAQHYGVTVIPARPGKPKDKAKVEVGVQLVERWIVAALRHRTFFSLAEVNAAIREKLAWLNARRFKHLPTSRTALFQTVERPALRPLPPRPYEFAQWKKAKVHIDCHIVVDHHYYSIPYQCIGQEGDVRLTAGTVEFLVQHRRVASHVRSYQKGGYTTVPEHLPPAHRQYLAWTPERILRWAGKTGPQTQALIDRVLARKSHPEQGFRSALGIIRLAQRYGPDRLEAACTRALHIQAYAYKSVHSILKNGLDHHPLPGEPEQLAVPGLEHPNIRGHHYYT